MGPNTVLRTKDETLRHVLEHGLNMTQREVADWSGRSLGAVNGWYQDWIEEGRLLRNADESLSRPPSWAVKAFRWVSERWLFTLLIVIMAGLLAGGVTSTGSAPFTYDGFYQLLTGLGVVGVGLALTRGKAKGPAGN